ncbi:MAG: hypothetical protein Q9159_007544 [Coniocarpon cinnabarinum]
MVLAPGVALAILGFAAIASSRDVPHHPHQKAHAKRTVQYLYELPNGAVVESTRPPPGLNKYMQGTSMGAPTSGSGGSHHHSLQYGSSDDQNSWSGSTTTTSATDSQQSSIGGGSVGSGNGFGSGSGNLGFTINTEGMKTSSAAYSSYHTSENSSQITAPITIPGQATISPDVPYSYTSRACAQKPASSAAQTTGDLTVNLINSYGVDLSLAYTNGAGSARESPTVLPSGTSTQVLYASGWSGRLVVGIDAYYQGSKIEGTYSNGAPPDIDVSYVDGYSVPIVCSDENHTPKSGCNLELFELGECEDLHGKTCVNPAVGIDVGPMPNFFAPCEGAAYTYPKDDCANVQASGTYYDCCDALELSDDSDIEVHPNVDKRSFIRAKQNQIHQDRLQRKHDITTLKYERIINDGLLTRIERLLSALKSHIDSTEAKEKPDEIVFQSMLESAGDPAEDKPPPRPEGVHAKVEEQPTYSKMMAALVEDVKKTVDEQKPSNEERVGAFVKEVGVHKAKVLDLQQQLLTRLAELEKIEGSKITSESIHTGFSTSHVAAAAAAPTKTTKSKQKSTSSTELLNPSSASDPNSHADPNPELDSGSEADVEDDTAPGPDPNLSSPIPDRQIHASKLGLQFAQLPSNAYQQYLSFIGQHPEVLAEKETDGLLMRAFDLQYAGRDAESKQSVHQALLLQYCRSLGRDGVAMFFKRVTTAGHQARKVFIDDVDSTYARLKERAAVMLQDSQEEAGETEQIQLHPVNPGQKINIVVPPPLAQCEDEETKQSRQVFDSFPPNLQKALESGSLDEVNTVLGRMPVPEAEEVVERLSAGGMLSLEQGLVDATTEEGRKQLEEMEKQGRLEEVAEEGGSVQEVIEGEPGHAVADGTAVEEKLLVDDVD